MRTAHPTWPKPERAKARIFAPTRSPSSPMVVSRRADSYWAGEYASVAVQPQPNSREALRTDATPAQVRHQSSAAETALAAASAGRSSRAGRAPFRVGEGRNVTDMLSHTLLAIRGARSRFALAECSSTMRDMAPFATA